MNRTRFYLLADGRYMWMAYAPVGALDITDLDDEAFEALAAQRAKQRDYIRVYNARSATARNKAAWDALFAANAPESLCRDAVAC